MILLPSFYEHDDFIDDNEEFELGGEDIKNLNNFSKKLKFKILKTPIFQIFTTLPTL